jgi:hypothetical protein
MKKFTMGIGAIVVIAIASHLFNKVPFEELDTLQASVKGDIVGYTPYQVTMWSLKAAESYRPWWYKDGEHQAIGLGYNHLGSKKRKDAISWATKDGKVTFKEAQIILSDYVEKIGESDKFNKKKLNTWQQVAVICHLYNCGSVTKWGVGACCGATNGCGRGFESHKERRKFELALWKGDKNFVKKKIKEYQQKASKLEADAKKQGL